MLQVEPLGLASRWKRGGASGRHIAAGWGSSVIDEEAHVRIVASIAATPSIIKVLKDSTVRRAPQHLKRTEIRKQIVADKNVIRI
ncbi:hypothetical protein [Caballeronia terrestris]|uniref:hypothetical protein n=1 Tax=Caballeronia terrestris TaxID=1226301 RepID=UPI001F299245|nr:hypothetical protein [Caballeronia terrestris]